MALLAASPCGDALSVDALLRSWRGAKGRLAPLPQPRLGYALPLRLAWLIIGFCYFFPGLSKLRYTGFAWIFSDNFKNTLYREWLDKGFMPISLLRIDQVPFLTQASAAVAVVFELSFIFLVLFPKIRPFAALVGLSFHNLTWYLMHIRFLSLQVAYVAFVNWHELFTRLGQFLFPEEATLVFSGPRMTRIVSSTRVFDLFGRIVYLNRQDEQALRSRGLRLSSAASLYFLTADKQQTGPDAFKALSARVIGLWPILPFLYLWRKPLYQLYQALDSDGTTSRRAAAEGGNTYGAAWRPTAVVGVFLFAGILTFGALNIGFGWPFAAYPTFAGVTQPSVTRYQMVKLEGGEEVPLNLSLINADYGVKRFQTLVLSAIYTEDTALRQDKLGAVWQLVASELDGVDISDAGRFYSTTVQTDPRYRRDRVVGRELLAEFGLDRAAQRTP